MLVVEGSPGSDRFVNFGFLCVAISWLILAGSPRELLGDVESGGCVRCSGTNSRPSAWLWQLHSTTVLVRK